MILRSERPDTEALWRSILGVLAAEPEYERRLDALLRLVGELTRLPYCYLYVADESGRRFRLERSRGGPEAVRDVPPGESTEGGAGAVAATPPLELARTPADERERVVSTAAGRLYSVPLALDGGLLGLIQAGPVPDGDPPARVRRALETARYPLAHVVRQARDEHGLRQRLGALTARVETGRRLEGSALDLERFVGLLLELALKSTRTEAGFVATVEPGSRRLAVRAERNMPPGFAGEVDLDPETGLFDWSPAAEGGALILRDFEAATRLGVSSLLAVPLLEGAQPLGIFALVNFGEGGTFGEESLELLSTFAEQIGLMLNNARLFQAFAAEYLETVKGLARSLDVRRPHTHRHHEHVSRVAEAVALALGLAADEVEAIRIAGLIHDVGMAAVAQVEGGYQADVEHPAVGASLVERLPLHPAVAESVATHHEWFDGWGFPQGLRGEEIPLGGRILAAAELVVELAAGDPVREPWPAERIAAELEQRRGSQLDPGVVDAALRLLPRLVPLRGGPSHESEEG